MTFHKPKDVSYTDMCIYVDNNIYKEKYDEQLIYEYIYHIIYMLAKKAQFFNTNSYYDDFAIYGANKVYLRFTNVKQYQLKEDGTPKLEKIKSVLNYIKTVLYPLKVDFEQSEYCQTISRDAYIDDIPYNFNHILTSTLDTITFCEFNSVLNDIGKTCKHFLKTIPYKQNSVEWLNIYTSVMLTFLNMVTLSNYRKERIEHLGGTLRLTDNHVIEAFEKEQERDAILFHLPDSMNDYIIVLARQLKHIVAKDLTDILHTNISNDISLLPLSINEYVQQFEECDNEY